MSRDITDSWMTQEYLKEILNYSEVTGDFFWRKKLGNRIGIGEKAGRKKSGYYRQITIKGYTFMASRLAWLWMTGDWPHHEIDHINLDKGDNRWCNLREATKAQNLSNRDLFRNNKSGYKGVDFEKHYGKWRARICFRGKRILLGYFDTPYEAHLAYCAAAIRYHGEFARAA